MELKYKLETKFTPPKVNTIYKFKIGSMAKVIKTTGWISIQKSDLVKIISRDSTSLNCEVIKGSRRYNTLWLEPSDLKIIKEG